MSLDKQYKHLTLISPRGFCAGVKRAIAIVEEALAKYGAPLYVRHEIVHNRHVVETLKARGVIFVKELHEVPDNACVIFSAHGVPISVFKEAQKQSLTYHDATCPLVSKIHNAVKRYAEQKYDILLIGHKDHPEVIGTMGQIQEKIHLIETVDDVRRLSLVSEKIAYVTQTTLSLDETVLIVEEIKKYYPHIQESHKKDICYATNNRQNAVKETASSMDLFLVIGSLNSSNSKRLVETAKTYGAKQAFLIENASKIPWDAVAQCQTIALTAGASAPEILVQEVISQLQKKYNMDVQTYEKIQENIQFSMPYSIRNLQ